MRILLCPCAADIVAMTRHQHHHHHHNHGGGGGIQHTTGAILLGAAAAAAAATHYANHQQQQGDANNRRRDVILVQQPLPPHVPSTTTTMDPRRHPPFLHAVRPGQRSMLVLNDGSHQRAPGWRLKNHCQLCLTRFGLFTRRHHCRNCGASVCWRHSAQKMPLPHYGFLNYVRVCASCYPALLDCYRRGQPYTPAALQQRIQQQQQQQQHLGGGAMAVVPLSNPYAGPDNMASYTRPTAHGAPLYTPVATASHAPTTSSSTLPQAQLIYDGSSAFHPPPPQAAAAVAPPTLPPPSAPGMALGPQGQGQGQGQPGADAYRLASGTAQW